MNLCNFFRFDKAGICKNVEDPVNSIQILEDKELTLTKESVVDGQYVQITPQRVRMKLRVGQESKMTFKVVKAKQFPVDLYYLMDLSNSMSDDRDNVVSTLFKVLE